MKSSTTMLKENSAKYMMLSIDRCISFHLISCKFSFQHFNINIIGKK